jgi:copper oxidase (laccase) domain-containing protein
LRLLDFPPGKIDTSSSPHQVHRYDIVRVHKGRAADPETQDRFQTIVFPAPALLERFVADCLPVYVNPRAGSTLNLE